MKTISPSKNASRIKRHKRLRSRISGSASRPRLAVYKSNKFVSAQLIDDAKGHTIASAHGRDFKGSKAVQAKAVGEAIAKAAKAAKIESVVFDRGGYQYAAQIKALADAARAGGLVF